MRCVISVILATILFADPGVANANDLTISLQGACPGRLTLSWEGAEPRKSAALFFAGNLGRIVIPNTMCQGTELGLGTDRGRLVRTFYSGAEGSGQILGGAPLSACGGYLQLMVAYGSPCATSNIVQIPQ